jgi:hypothetical protein
VNETVASSSDNSPAGVDGAPFSSVRAIWLLMLRMPLAPHGDLDKDESVLLYTTSGNHISKDGTREAHAGRKGIIHTILQTST